MLSLAELRTRIKQFTALDLDSYLGEEPSDLDLGNLINWSVRTISEYSRCNYSDRIQFVLTAGTDLYNLRDTPTVVSKKVLEPHYVVINGATLYSPSGDRGLWSYRDLIASYPRYRDYDDGVPSRAVWMPNSKLLLSCPPDAATAAQTHYIAGFYIASDMIVNSADGQYWEGANPDLPEELHETVVYLSAFRAAMPNVAEAEGWQRLAAYDKTAWQRIQEYRRQAKSLLAGPNTRRGENGGTFQDIIWS